MMPASKAIEQAKLEKLKALEHKDRLVKGLPYLYGFKDYKWSKEFLESRNKMCLLTAANQIGKSTIQIRKMIHWATAKHLWSQLWHKEPRLFWYLYPDKNTATQEFETKWIYLLPSGEFKDHPIYGWHEEYENKKISSIKFNSGVVLIFKTYAQDAQNLQSGTVDYMGCDEELPYELWDELKFRLTASKGYFSLVFTATLGQEFWRQAMEERGTTYERFPNAAKWQVSAFDCLFHCDGKRSHWTEEYINQVIAECSSENEVQKRVFGKFVLTEGRKYETFSIKENTRQGGKIPEGWMLYFGIDYGSGGDKGHPAAIACVAVKPDMTAARVVRAWRGDKIVTDAGYIINVYKEMLAELTKEGRNPHVSSWYDYSAKDLFTIASRMSLSLARADKAHDKGEGVLGTLFKNKMLFLDEEQPEIMKLAFELTSLRHDTPKTKAKDDLTDALRYACVAIAWNWTHLTGRLDTYKEPKKEPTEVEDRRDPRSDFRETEDEANERQLIEEFEEWNESYGN